MIYKADKVLEAIESRLFADQGAAYRVWLGKVIGHIGDAYSPDNDPFRTHLGASIVGRKCSREIWYGFRWATRKQHQGRMVRLFNRGHLEEARFIALLLTIGCTVYQQDADGKQFRIKWAGGHAGGSTDGIVVGVPGLAVDMPCLTEFKTHGDKSFQKLKKEGVQAAKPEHFTQMQLYMKKKGLTVALYMAVNKNDDELWAEFVMLDDAHAEFYFDRGEKIVFFREPPPKINESPSWYECSFCDHKPICHGKGVVDRNCRTCDCSEALPDGSWVCNNINTCMALNSGLLTAVPLTKEMQLKGCGEWKAIKGLPA